MLVSLVVGVSVKSAGALVVFFSSPPEDAQPIANVATASVATARCENFPRRIRFPSIPFEFVLTAIAASAERSRLGNAPSRAPGMFVAAYSRDSPAPPQYRSVAASPARSLDRKSTRLNSSHSQ